MFLMVSGKRKRFLWRRKLLEGDGWWGEDREREVCWTGENHKMLHDGNSCLIVVFTQVLCNYCFKKSLIDCILILKYSKPSDVTYETNRAQEKKKFLFTKMKLFLSSLILLVRRNHHKSPFTVFNFITVGEKKSSSYWNRDVGGFPRG